VGSEPVPYPDASGGVVITHNVEYELQDAVCDVPGATGLPAPAIHQETQQP
jgi:hypothetical protein